MSVTIIARDAELADEVLILADGENRFKNHPPLTLTQADADRIVAAFREHGTDIPFDVEHATVVRAPKGESAPAVGWVTALRYEAGRGLVASVRWTDDGRKALESKAYRYFSPVIDWNPKTGDLLAIHSVALTNKPRTVKQAALMAASLAEDIDMSKNNPPDAPPKPEPADLKRAGEQLRAWGVNLSEAAVSSADSLLAVAMETLDRFYTAFKQSGPTPPEEIAGQVSASAELRQRLAASLNLDAAKASTETIIGRIEAMSKDEKGLATQVAALSEQVKSLQTERDAASAARLLASAVDEGKILPDSDLHKWATKFANSAPADFAEWAKAAPIICEPGRRMAASEGAAGATASKGDAQTREAVIRTAMSEYDSLPAVDRGMFSRVGMVNRRLHEAGFDRVPETELAKFVAK